MEMKNIRILQHGSDLFYDKNNNTTYDVNGNIWGIHYNILNLPKQFSSGMAAKS